MVAIEKVGQNFVFTVNGLHKLWAVKSELTIPVSHITNVNKNQVDTIKYLGIRYPGTYIPHVITAGSFLVDEGTIFCDFTNNDNIIVIELHDEKYKRLVIEVEDVEKSLTLLNSR